MRGTFLSFSPPAIGREEIDEVIDTLKSDWITTGPKVARFEEEFRDLVGCTSCVAVSSATHAMEVGLAALGVRPGDEIITSTMTFCSTAHVVEHLGATPVLVDVEPDTLNLDPELVESAVTKRTRGILPVHLYGHPADLDRIRAIADRHGLFVLEDAAHALPAKYRGTLVGAAGSCAAFSFYATKNITTAEGGMLTGDEDLIRRARKWSLHGMSRDAHMRYGAGGSWYYEVELPGFKCNMTDIQASLGLQQLRKLGRFQDVRRQIVSRYNEALSSVDEVIGPVEREDVESALHLYVVRLELERLRIDRARFITELRARNIGSSVHFIPVHTHPYYRDKYGYKPTDFPVAWDAYQRIVSLPLHPRLTAVDVADVIEAVISIVREHRR